jgi:hypothetical protein
MIRNPDKDFLMPSRRSSKKDSPAKRLEGALDELRAAVFEAYAAIAEEGAKTGTEQQRRESALQFIDEILEGRPLATFSATNLELLETLFAYWREAEVAEDALVVSFQ